MILKLIPFLWLSTTAVISYASLTEIQIGGLYEPESDAELFVFHYAVEKAQEGKQLKISGQSAAIISNDPFSSYKEGCTLLENNVTAVFGPQSPQNVHQIQSLCNHVNIPHIKTTISLDETYSPFTINIHLNSMILSKAYLTVVQSIGFVDFWVLYEKSSGLFLLEEIIKSCNTSCKLARLPSNRNYQGIFKEILNSGINRVIINVEDPEHLKEIFNQMEEIGMTKEFFDIFVTSLDLHTINLPFPLDDHFQVIGLSLIQSNSKIFKTINNEYRQHRQSPQTIKTSSALVYDAVKLVTTAIKHLTSSMHINQTSLVCRTDTKWNQGKLLLDYIKQTEVEGLSGTVKIDEYGVRKNVGMDIIQLQNNGLLNIGRLDIKKTSINFKGRKRYPRQIRQQTKYLKVAGILAFPYIKVKKNTSQNKTIEYEGFCIDLLDKLSSILGFNYTLSVKNQSYAAEFDPNTQKWKGLLGRLKNYEADIAIGPIVITENRRAEVDFTPAWWTYGVSVLYRKQEPLILNRFWFMAPFSMEIWIYFGVSFIAVSALLCLITRFSPCEQSFNADSEDKYPFGIKAILVHDKFSLYNSFWFSIRSLTQQGGEPMPRGISGRILAATIWILTVIMVAIYTAGLVNFMTPKPNEPLIKSLTDLTTKDIAYGLIKDGSIHKQLQASDLPEHRKMIKTMDFRRPSVYVKNAEDGIDRVGKSDGMYAFITDTTIAEYATERQCYLDYTDDGDFQNSFAIALQRGSPYKQFFSEAITQLRQDNYIEKLHSKWWQEKGGGKCQQRREFTDIRPMGMELGQQNFHGIFILLVIGVIGAIIVLVIEAVCMRRSRFAIINRPTGDNEVNQ